jgi:hypothetical protein
MLEEWETEWERFIRAQDRRLAAAILHPGTSANFLAGAGPVVAGGGAGGFADGVPVTRLRKVPAPPLDDLRGLRQAWEDAGSYAAAAEALDAFLAALDRVRSPAELDTLDRAAPQPRRGGRGVPEVLAWGALAAFWVTGSTVLLVAAIVLAVWPVSRKLRRTRPG